MSLRCAIYPRYSSDQQSPLSLGDQIRKCREYAQQQGWKVLDGYVYTDAEISGAGSDRPALQRLLTCLEIRPRSFDVLLIDDTIRLSRRQATKATSSNNCVSAASGSVSQGIDSISEQADVLMTFHGLMDSIYLKELGKKRPRTGRADSTRKSRRRPMLWLPKLDIRGRCSASGQRARARIVLRIFEMSASGLSRSLSLAP